MALTLQVLAFLTSVCTLVAAIIAVRKVDNVHGLINSRMSELLIEKGKASFAAGENSEREK